MFTVVLFTIAKTWKQSGCSSTDECVRKMYYIQKMEYYSAIKEENPAIAATWIDLEGIMLSKISQTKTKTV